VQLAEVQADYHNAPLRKVTAGVQPVTVFNYHETKLRRQLIAGLQLVQVAEGVFNPAQLAQLAIAQAHAQIHGAATPHQHTTARQFARLAEELEVLQLHGTIINQQTTPVGQDKHTKNWNTKLWRLDNAVLIGYG
jgi:hypothetical protein